MFKKSRIKIIISILTAMMVFFVLSVLIIYGTYYKELSDRNMRMLDKYTQHYEPGNVGLGVNNGRVKPVGDDSKPPEKKEKKSVYELSDFYSVSFNDDESVLAADDGGGDVYTATELEDIARAIMAKGKEAGHYGNLIYKNVQKDGYRLVAFLDNTVINASTGVLINNTIIMGIIALGAAFVISLLVSRRIIKPLERNDRAQRQFISDAGHELKTPVAVIKTNAELLKREIGQNKWLSNIGTENERMAVLVEELLSLSRAGGTNVNYKELDFSRLVEEEALLFESVIYENGLSLVSDIEPDISVEGDAQRLKRLVSILLDNAVSHNSGVGEISLSLKKDGRAVVLTCVNAAADLPDGEEKLIFDRFYRADKARSSESGHYGLGLAIAKAITEAHKGSIEGNIKDGKAVFMVRFV